MGGPSVGLKDFLAKHLMGQKGKAGLTQVVLRLDGELLTRTGDIVEHFEYL